MNIPAWQYIVIMSAYMLILFGMHELLRRHLKFSHWFFILALFTFPLWLNNLHGWFRWVKTLSVLVPIVFVNLVRIYNFSKKGKWENMQKTWVFWVFWLLLFLNIFEASIKDMNMGNYFNGFSGLLLAVTIPLPPKFWRIDNHKYKKGDLILELTFAWCFLYTTWKACFVYAENTGFLASSICILTIPFLYALFRKPDLYMSARVYTLGFHLLIRAIYDVFTPVIDSSGWANTGFLYYWGMFNLVLHLPFAIWWFARGRKKILA